MLLNRSSLIQLKKMTRKSLDKRAETMPVLTEAEMKSYRGGHNYEINELGIVRFPKATTSKYIDYDKDGIIK